MGKKHLVMVALGIAIFVVPGRAEESAVPWNGWTTEQFAADRREKAEELSVRAEAWFRVRREMLAPCPDCGGRGGGGTHGSATSAPKPCERCLGTGGDVPRDYDPDRLFCFHFGHDREEAAPGRTALSQMLRGKRPLAVFLPLESSEISDVRINGARGVVIAATRRSNIPHFMRLGVDHVDVSKWIRVDGRWWLVDGLLMSQMPNLKIPEVPEYPEAERPRPRHVPAALALITRAAGLIAPSPLSRDMDVSLRVKVRPPGAKRDEKFDVTTDENHRIQVHDSGSHDDSEDNALWLGRIGQVLNLLLGEPLVPLAADFHLRLTDANPHAVLGEGFSPGHALRTFVAAFGEGGLPVSVAWSLVGEDRTLIPEFARKGDQYVISRLTLKYGGNRRPRSESYEIAWKKVKGFWLPSKVVHTAGEAQYTYGISRVRVMPQKE